VEASELDPEKLLTLTKRKFYKCGLEGLPALYGIMESEFLEPPAISNFVAETLKMEFN